MPHVNAEKNATESQDKETESRDKALRFRVACRLLRNSGAIDTPMPGQKRGESQIDWLVRIGIALDKYTAAEALIAAKRRTKVLDETLQLLQSEAAEDVEINAITDARDNQSAIQININEM